MEWYPSRQLVCSTAEACLIALVRVVVFRAQVSFLYASEAIKVYISLLFHCWNYNIPLYNQTRGVKISPCAQALNNQCVDLLHGEGMPETLPVWLPPAFLVSMSLPSKNVWEMLSAIYQWFHIFSLYWVWSVPFGSLKNIKHIKRVLLCNYMVRTGLEYSLKKC